MILRGSVRAGYESGGCEGKYLLVHGKGFMERSHGETNRIAGGLVAVLAVYIASWDWDLASVVHLLGGNTYVRVGLETESGTGADKAAKICDWK